MGSAAAWLVLISAVLTWSATAAQGVFLVMQSQCCDENSLAGQVQST